MRKRLGIEFAGSKLKATLRSLLAKASEPDDDGRDCENVPLILRSSLIPAGFTVVFGARERTLFHGISSEEDINRALAEGGDKCRGASLFLVRLTRENLHGFRTGLLDRADVLFVLDYVPTSVEERHHAFGLFHKSLSLRRTGAFLFYYNRVIEMLTTCGELPAAPPCLLEHLGVHGLFYQCGVLRDRVWQRFDLWHNRSRRRARSCAPRIAAGKLNSCRHAVITGWYGTETAGDKAILLEVIHVLRERLPGIRISITSIVPGLSRLTNLECGIDAGILELRDLDYGQLESVDLVVFGGGPMMDSSQLKYIETLFEWARRRGAVTMAFGCGVGPLKSDAGRRRVRSILANTDHAFFRDERSAALARELGFAGELRHACDPALRYVRRWREENRCGKSDGASGDKMVTLLRAQTMEYSSSAGEEADWVRSGASGFIREYLAGKPARTVQMLPMHTFWFGNDDRDYTRLVGDGVLGEGRPELVLESPSLEMLLQSISEAAVGLPMRFHGHIFLLALEIPFVSINYTGPGGKVFNLIERYGMLEYSVNVNEKFSAETLRRRLEKLQRDVESVRQRTRSQLARDLAKLESIYDELFGVEESSL